jgi:hypothetical protein
LNHALSRQCSAILGQDREQESAGSKFFLKEKRSYLKACSKKIIEWKKYADGLGRQGLRSCYLKRD